MTMLQLTRSYLICGAERTGSTLLGNALEGTGVAGRPKSYFNRVAHFNPRIQQILGNAKDDDKYLDKVIIAATTPNGVFGAKVHWEHFLNLIAKVERTFAGTGRLTATIAERLQLRLPDLRYVWLTRMNAVARAVSHFRVTRTNRWQLDSRWVTDDSGGEGEPEFDFDEIEKFVRRGESEDSSWRHFFEVHRIEPLMLTYEDVVDDLGGALRRVLRFLDIPADNVQMASPTLRKQADGRSREWEQRYRRMRGEEGR